MNIKILVILHKKFWTAKDDVYLPLQVGAEEKNDLGFLRDNTGDNISLKNSSFCELTGLYWAWKNLDCTYIGLCHYRRYFAFTDFAFTMKGKKSAILQKKDYEKILNNFDVILPNPFLFKNNNVRGQFNLCHNEDDLNKTEYIVKQLYPSYINSFYKIMNNNKLYTFNMFVMSKENLDKYCEWLFPILFELEKKVDISKYDEYQKRVFGFLSERLFNVWLDMQELKIKEMPVIILKRTTIHDILHYFKILLKYL